MSNVYLIGCQENCMCLESTICGSDSVPSSLANLLLGTGFFARSQEGRACIGNPYTRVGPHYSYINIYIVLQMSNHGENLINTYV
jgi:hypothetical protein